MAKRSEKKPIVENNPTTEQLVAEDHFLLHTLLDLLMEKEFLAKAELEDKLDSIESEFFVDECEEKKQARKTLKKVAKKKTKKPAKKKRK